MSTTRRQWLKRSSLAAMGLTMTFRSFAHEDGFSRDEDYGSQAGLVNLGANENPYGISPLARQAIMDMIPLSNRYQFNIPSVLSFKKQLADYYKVSPDYISITAGSTEILTLLPKYFRKGNIVTASPTFNTLPTFSAKAGMEVMEVPLNAAKEHDLPKMLASINAYTQLVYICNPANPTATIIKPAVLKSFCEEAARKTLVVIDEAYIDFLNAPDNESMIALIEKNPNVVVLRTFSKILGMAGLRIGFMVAHPSLISKLEDDYFQYTQMGASNLSIAAASASLKDEAHRAECKQKNDAARAYTTESLKKLGIQPIPSFTNFIFFPLGKYPGDFAKDMLGNHNILLRSNTYPDGKWGRVSMGTMDEMKQFISVMQQTWKYA